MGQFQSPLSNRPRPLFEVLAFVRAVLEAWLFGFGSFRLAGLRFKGLVFFGQRLRSVGVHRLGCVGLGLGCGACACCVGFQGLDFQVLSVYGSVP